MANIATKVHRFPYTQKVISNMEEALAEDLMVDVGQITIAAITYLGEYSDDNES